MRPRLIAAALAALMSGPALAAAPVLTPVVTSDIVFNGVTTTKDGQTFVSYPRSDPTRGIEVGRVVADRPSPFPDAAWNGWAPGRDGHGVFVWANALRIGPDGMLWVVDAGAPGPGKTQVPGGAKVVRLDPMTGAVRAVFRSTAR